MRFATILNCWGGLLWCSYYTEMYLNTFNVNCFVSLSYYTKTSDFCLVEKFMSLIENVYNLFHESSQIYVNSDGWSVWQVKYHSKGKYLLKCKFM